MAGLPPSAATRFLPGTIRYTAKQSYIIPEKDRIGSKINFQTTSDIPMSSIGERTFMKQKHYFEVFPPPRSNPKRDRSSQGKLFYERIYQSRAANYYNLETKIIWRAFDVPELTFMMLHDEQLRGTPKTFSRRTLRSVLHWLHQCRYWRAIGISHPFLNEVTLRSYSSKNRARYTGNFMHSGASIDAVADLERARKRKELGLDPNYTWETWGPMGLADGSRPQYLPRMLFDPYVDPDGVEVSRAEVARLNRHQVIKKRYKEFIFASTKPYYHVWGAIGNGGLTIGDLADGQLLPYYMRMLAADKIDSEATDTLNMSSAESDAHKSNDESKEGVDSGTLVVPRTENPADLRLLLLCSGVPWYRNHAAACKSLEELRALPRAPLHEMNAMIDFARLLHNTRDDVARVRRFFEEKCGFADFMFTSDKEITAATIACVRSVLDTEEKHSWARAMLAAPNENQWEKIMGSDTYALYRVLEECIADKRRRAWATRFSGEANEESTLDYMLRNFGKRTEPKEGGAVNVTGQEFDREYEPIGRNIQRRVLHSEKDTSEAAVEDEAEARRLEAAKMRYEERKSSYDAFDKLHSQQVQKRTPGGSVF